MILFKHSEKDQDGFRYITSQLIINGVCKPKEIIECFGMSGISVKRWVKRYRESEELSDFVSKKNARNTRLTEEIVSQIQL